MVLSSRLTGSSRLSGRPASPNADSARPLMGRSLPLDYLFICPARGLDGGSPLALSSPNPGSRTTATRQIVGADSLCSPPRGPESESRLMRAAICHWAALSASAPSERLSGRPLSWPLFVLVASCWPEPVSHRYYLTLASDLCSVWVPCSSGILALGARIRSWAPTVADLSWLEFSALLLISSSRSVRVLPK